MMMMMMMMNDAAKKISHAKRFSPASVMKEETPALCAQLAQCTRLPRRLENKAVCALFCCRDDRKLSQLI